MYVIASEINKKLTIENRNNKKLTATTAYRFEVYYLVVSEPKF